MREQPAADHEQWAHPTLERSSEPLPHPPYLEVYGARVHNLKNIDVRIPRQRLVVFTGISGSGKSSLAFDTIYAEGQRRFLESMPSYARQFLGAFERPDVDEIHGLSPVISIEQKTINKNPRSTIGTVTEVYDFLRLLFARCADAYSLHDGRKLIQYSDEQIVAQIHHQFSGRRILLLAPLVRGRKGHYRELFEQYRRQGFLKVRVDGKLCELKEKMQVDRYRIHDIELVVDRLEVAPSMQERIEKSVQLALRLGKGNLIIVDAHDEQQVAYFSRHLVDPQTGISIEMPSPNTFSFNSPYGACPQCKGLGFTYEVRPEDLIPDPSKSINEGGLLPLKEVRDTVVFRQLRALAKKYKFTLATPLRDIPKEAFNMILYGSPKEKVVVPFAFDDSEINYATSFEGIIPLVMRSYQEAPNEKIKLWAEVFMATTTCSACRGTRLKPESLAFRLAEKNIAELAAMSISDLYQWFLQLDPHLSQRQRTIGQEVIKEIRSRLAFLVRVGLDYLTLDRPTRTLSGGEAQRIRLATQMGSQLSGVTYVLDEPSIGLHHRDNCKLIDALQQLCRSGNTVLVVEHDKEIMRSADYLIDLGPGAGEHGGYVITQGPPQSLQPNHSLTVDYLLGRRTLRLPEVRRSGSGKKLVLTGCAGHNLKHIDVSFPLGTLICVTGVSGSGKSSLITETLYPLLCNQLYGTHKKPLPYKQLLGVEYIDKVIEVDQSPIGRTPRSNPATYIGVFTEIRSLFALLPEARVRGYGKGRFSFNVKGGRCEHCQGGGIKCIEMNFLPDVYVTCEQCMGKRYNRETLEIRYQGKSISDVLEMTVEEAVAFFAPYPSIQRKLYTLHQVGLGYMRLGQQATTLSGGEAQRVKLAAELARRDTGKTFYILDEPTTGLHFEDIRLLMDILGKLVDKGNTVLIIEHNLDVIKMADYIIDLGPEGGAQGGFVVAQGTPEELIRQNNGYTAAALRKELLNC